MTIYINGKFLAQRLTGVQRYAFEITRALISANIDVKIIVPPFLDISKTDLPRAFILPVGSINNMVLWEQLSVYNFLRDKKNYVLLSLCNMGTLFNQHQIICIHDMTYKVNPQWFSRSFSKYYSFMIPRLAKVAKRIITVSEFSKKEIQEQLKLNEKKISVVYNAPSNKFSCTSVDSIISEKEDFFLFVGSMDPRKNLSLLIDLFSLKDFASEKLVIVGAKSKSFDEVNLNIPPNVKLLDKCDDDQLADLYKKAKGMINASFYEGFGIPVVEAMASGCPLIISDLEVFREIAGDQAIYFNPSSLDAIKRAFQIFLNKSAEEIREMTMLAYHRSQSFTWENSSKVLLNVINEL